MKIKEERLEVAAAKAAKDEIVGRKVIALMIYDEGTKRCSEVVQKKIHDLVGKGKQPYEASSTPLKK